MARLAILGAEIDGTYVVPSPPDGVWSGAVPTRDTTVFRSGAASYKFDMTGTNTVSYLLSTIGTPVDGRSYFFRGYVRAAAAPATASEIVALTSGPNEPVVRFRTDGTVELVVSGAAQGSPSAAITDSNWHRVELMSVAVATNNWGSAELRLDGATVATWSGTQARASNGDVNFGWRTVAGASKVINFDDVVVNDSTGAANNSWPGAGAVVLLKPTADSAVGTGWTLGTGTAVSANAGATAVQKTPPTGVADLAAGSDPKQIRNATSNANSNYDATMTTYTAAGVGASDTVNALQCWVATAAPVATAAKLGTVGIVSNPAVANVNLAASGTAGAFWIGAAGGAYPSGWKWSPGTMTQAPTITKGTAPVMRITQVTASTRIAVVCGMYIYVDYSPASATTYAKAGYAKENA